MSQIEKYRFEGPKGNPYVGEWTTLNAKEATEHAARRGLRVIATVYSFSHEEVVADYTGDDAEHAGASPGGS